MMCMMNDELAKNLNVIFTCGLVKNTNQVTKVTDIEGKIPSITGLAITAALNVVRNEIPNVSDVVK